jgi:hypothetical protein
VACRDHGVPYLTRLNRLDLLDQPDVARALRGGRWHMVPDSRSGPRRSALDLGIVTVPPGADTRRADGTPYEPVATRVVVSRYPRAEKAEHGRVLDGWQYELFAVDVSADALPAAEVVAAYFGRGGQENRFAQEDREAGLDRIFSYHLPGQELAWWPACGSGICASFGATSWLCRRPCGRCRCRTPPSSTGDIAPRSTRLRSQSRPTHLRPGGHPPGPLQTRPAPSFLQPAWGRSGAVEPARSRRRTLR